MRAAVTDRLLERLTPWQRCGVIFAALAREDFEEANRLADTAPMGAYRAADFFEPFTRVMLVAALARGDNGNEVGREWQMRCSWATLMHQGRDTETLDRLWEAAEAIRARALWGAYARAVTDAGLYTLPRSCKAW
jgi:hypothetical protein